MHAIHFQKRLHMETCHCMIHFVLLAYAVTKKRREVSGDSPSRVLSRIFVLGGKMLKVIVDGGCRHKLQFSRGIWGHAPQKSFEF